MSRVYIKRYDGDGWQEVVTDANDEVRFNFTFDNLENPTNYVSESAYSLKLPRCPENNKCFGQFGRLDSMIVAGGYDPTRKMQYMVLDSAGLLISTGDAVLSEINSQYYVLSLTGSQAHLFSKLVNAGWDTAKASDDSTYTLMTDWLKMVKTGPMFLDEQTNTMSRALVYASWRIDNPLFSFSEIRGAASLLSEYGLASDANLTETLAFIASLVGFAPTAQGRYKGFESDKWLEVGAFYIGDLAGYGPVYWRAPSGVAGYGNAAYLPVLCNERDFNNEPTHAIEIKDGTIEPQMAEYRSYYQQPFIYMSALWQMVAYDFAAITGGYTLQLDSRWFNADNEKGLVYMLPQLFDENDLQIGEASPVNGTHLNTMGSSGSPSHVPAHVLSDYTYEYTLSNVITLNITERGVFSGNIALSFGLGVSTHTENALCFTTCNAILCTVKFCSHNDEKFNKYFIICPLPDDGSIKKEDYYNDTYLNLYQYVGLGYEVLWPTYTPFHGDDDWTFLTDITNEICTVYKSGLADPKEISIEYGFVNDYNVFIDLHDADNLIYTIYPPKLKIEIDGSVAKYREYRSGSRVSLERLFQNLNPFDVLLQYTKSRHLVWLVDDNSKTVTVERAQDYFADCESAGVPDISAQVDTGGGVKVQPLSWNERKVVFNFDDTEADYIGDYAEKYGQTYGSQTIVTQSQLNNETKKLLGSSTHDTIKTSAMLSQTILSRTSLESSKQDWFETHPMPLNVSDGESANVYGNFYYRHRNAVWLAENALRKPSVHITDDTPKEQVFRRFAWHGDDAYDPAYGAAAHISTSVRPVFNTVSEEGLSVLFAPVRELYTSTPDQPTVYLFGHCWQNYIGEVYNAQNKTVEMDISLPRRVFDTVRNNPLVIIDHVLYLLTSIEGWGEHNTKCRCTLRQITDIDNLTS